MNRTIKNAGLFVLFLLFLCAPRSGQGQTHSLSRYREVDALMAAYSQTGNNHPDSVVRFVKSYLPEPEDRVRAFYTWIALNISYDKSLLDQYKVTTSMQMRNFRPGGHSQDADTVLAHRKAVCEGFCNLMNYFCSKVNIPSVMVVGITRSPEGQVVENILHTWNAVKIDSSWKLLDITWSGGYVNSSDQYVKKFSGLYFFTDPSEFVLTHWPLDAMWQTLDRPLTKSEFYKEEKAPGSLRMNYADSIAAYLKLKPGEKEYVDLQHYLRYDPENRMYKEGCDHYIYNKAATQFNKAALYFEDYTAYARKLKGKEIGLPEVKKCIRLLNEPKKYLELGLLYSRNQTFYMDSVKEKFDLMVQSSTKRLVEVNSYLDSYRKMQAALK